MAWTPEEVDPEALAIWRVAFPLPEGPLGKGPLLEEGPFWPLVDMV